MKIENLGVFAVLGIAFSLLLNVLYEQGIFIDTWISSLGETLTISDVMVFNFIVWVVVGLFYVVWRD